MLARLHLADLPSDVTAIQSIALEQNRIARQLWEQLDILKHQVAQFARARFGASSEQLPGQAELFVNTVTVPVPPPAPGTTVTGHVRRGRPALPKDLPRERIEYDLTDVEKAEFDRIERIGEEVSGTLNYTPAKLTVIEHARFKYACRKDGESTIRTAFAQPSPLLKSNASAGLLVQIGVAAFVNHLPLSRQENDLWVDHHPPAVLFEFAESREAIHPLTFLTDYQGYLHADAYSGYTPSIRPMCRIPCDCCH